MLTEHLILYDAASFPSGLLPSWAVTHCTTQQHVLEHLRRGHGLCLARWGPDTASLAQQARAEGLPPIIVYTPTADEAPLAEIFRAGAWDAFSLDAIDAPGLAHLLHKVATRYTQAQRDYLQMLNDLDEAICHFDADGTLRFVNQTFCQNAGATREQLIGQNLFDFVSSNQMAAQLHASLKTFSPDNPIQTQVYYAPHADGAHYYERWTARGFFDDAGQLTHVQARGLDTSETRQALQQLHTSQHRLRLVAENYPDGFIVLFDADLRLLLVAGQGLARFPDDTSDHEGQRVYDTITPDYWDHLIPVYEATLRGEATKGLITHYEGRILISDFTPIYDENKQVSMGMVTTKDITDAYQAQAQHAFQAHLLNTLSEAVYATDAEYRITLWTAGAEAISGYSQAEALGQVAFDLLNMDLPDDLDTLRAKYEQTGEWRGELTAYRQDGTPIRVQAYSKVLFDDDGNLSGTVNVAHDVTEMRRAQAKVEYQAQLLDWVMDAVIAVDPSYHILSWNKAAEQIYGYTEDEVLGKSVNEVLRPAFDAETQQQIKQDVATKGTWKGELTHHHKDGTPIPILAYGRALTDEAGNVSGFVTANRDITEMRRAQAALEYQAQLLDWVMDAVIAVDAEFHILSWNKAAERIYGYTAEETIGKPIQEILQGEYIDTDEHTVLAEFLREGIWKGNIIHRHKDGSSRYIEAHTRALQEKEGQFQGAVSVNRDVTDVRQAEVVRQRSHTILQSMSDAVIVVDSDVRVTDWNPAAERLYSRSKAQVLGQVLHELAPAEISTPEGYQPAHAVVPHIIQVLYDKGQWWGELRHDLSEDQTLHIYASYTALQDAYGHMNGAVGVHQDITPLKAAEQHKQTLEIQNARLAMLRNFIGNASHDLLTPITNLRTSLYLLGRVEDETRRAHYRQKMQYQIDRLERLLATMLSISSLDEDDARHSFSFAAYNVNELVRHILKTYETERQRRKHTLHTAYISHPVHVWVDETRIREAIGEIYINAINYTPPEGKVYIRLSAEADTACIRIQDSGVGMTQEEQKRIFEPFYRVDSARNSESGSGGLGLALAKRIIELHEGRIVVDSEAGTGTAIAVYLPLAHDTPLG